VTFYPDGASCSGDGMVAINGNNNQNFYCLSATIQSHDLSTTGIVAAGKKVVLYSDDGCQDGVTGYLDTDGCHITPEGVSILKPEADLIQLTCGQQAPVAAFDVVDK
jgi:hypothetical protein